MAPRRFESNLWFRIQRSTRSWPRSRRLPSPGISRRGIFVRPVDDAVRARAAERGEAAIR